jgi:hypothetical protein
MRTVQSETRDTGYKFWLHVGIYFTYLKGLHNNATVITVEIKPWKSIEENRIWQKFSHNSRSVFELDLPPVNKRLNVAVSVLLGYYTAFSGNCLLTFRDNLSAASSRVKNWISWPLKMGRIVTTACCEISQKSAHHFYFAAKA